MASSEKPVDLSWWGRTTFERKRERAARIALQVEANALVVSEWRIRRGLQAAAPAALTKKNEKKDFYHRNTTSSGTKGFSTIREWPRRPSGGPGIAARFPSVKKGKHEVVLSNFNHPVSATALRRPFVAMKEVLGWQLAEDASRLDLKHVDIQILGNREAAKRWWETVYDPEIRHRQQSDRYEAEVRVSRKVEALLATTQKQQGRTRMRASTRLQEREDSALGATTTRTVDKKASINKTTTSSRTSTAATATGATKELKLQNAGVVWRALPLYGTSPLAWSEFLDEQGVGFSALSIAVKSRDVSFAAFLTDNGADRDQMPGSTLDHWADFAPAEETWDPLTRHVVDKYLFATTRESVSGDPDRLSHELPPSRRGGASSKSNSSSLSTTGRSCTTGAEPFERHDYEYQSYNLHASLQPLGGCLSAKAALGARAKQGSKRMERHGECPMDYVDTEYDALAATADAGGGSSLYQGGGSESARSSDSQEGGRGYSGATTCPEDENPNLPPLANVGVLAREGSNIITGANAKKMKMSAKQQELWTLEKLRTVMTVRRPVAWHCTQVLRAQLPWSRIVSSESTVGK
ncbi:unnamed protein product [Amoebophrya sp. A25]|nr:unnamed protein product [Amoebophrya sp. A25]|eukprot:GSA25T00019665001.1